MVTGSHTRIFMTALVALNLAACASSQPSSFATNIQRNRLSHGAKKDDDELAPTGSQTNPQNVLAVSGNVLLPGALAPDKQSVEVAQLSAAPSELTASGIASPSSVVAVAPLAGQGVTGVSTLPDGAPTTESIAVTPDALSASSSVGLLGATPAQTSLNVVNNPTASSLAGQPLLQPTGPVLAGVTAIGSASSPTIDLAGSITPATAVAAVANAAGATVMMVTSSTPTSNGGLVASAPAGLGSLTTILPGMRH